MDAQEAEKRIRAMNIRRILYVAGPGDVAATYEHWKRKQDDPHQIAITYSGQFFDACHKLGIKAILISSNNRSVQIKDGNFDIRQYGHLFQGCGGLRYHLGQYIYNAKMAYLAVKNKCDVIVTSSQSHLVPFQAATLLGVRLIPSLHCTFWPKLLPRKLVGRIITSLDRRILKSKCSAFLSISTDVSAQLEEITGGTRGKVERFVPTYRESNFQHFQMANPNTSPFRVLYSGRIEPDKGVLDLPRIGKLLKERGLNVAFDVAGEGSATEELKRRISEDRMDSSFKVHGYCYREKMQELLEACHAVIIPTRSDFVEGFNKVVVESVLSLRPFITSRACPALSDVSAAGMEVACDDVVGYANAIETLATNKELYKQKHATAASLRERYFDEANGWGSAFVKALADASRFSSNIK